MLLSFSGFMLLSLFGSFLLLSCVEHVSAEPKVVHMQTKHRSRGTLGKRDFGDGNTVDVALVQNRYYYYVNMTVGTPGEEVAFDIDTGSSDTWMLGPELTSDKNNNTQVFFHAGNSSTCSVQQDSSFTFDYVDGTQILGKYFTDDLSVGELKMKQVTMGLANGGHGNAGTSNVDIGIMGLGPSISQVNNTGAQKRMTILDQMVSQKLIKSHTFSLWFDSVDSGQGNILFGGFDRAKFIGDLSLVDIQPPQSSFTVVLSSLVLAADEDQYDFQIQPLPVILDTGTTLTSLPTEIFDSLANYLMAEYRSVQQEKGLYEYWIVSCDLKDRAGALYFQFGSGEGPWINVPFSELAPLSPDLTVMSGAPACGFGLIPNNKTDGHNLLGDTFLRSVYTLYNLESMQIGIANTWADASGSDYFEISSGTDLGSVSVTTVAGPTLSQTAPVSVLPPKAALASGTISDFTKQTVTPTTVIGAVITTVTEIKKQASGTSTDASSSSTNTSAATPAAQEPSTFPILILALCGSMMLMGAMIV